MYSQTSVRHDTAIFQVHIGPSEGDAFGDYGNLRLRLVRHVTDSNSPKQEPDVKRWSLVSTKFPTLAEKEITDEQARDLLEGYFMRQAAEQK